MAKVEVQLKPEILRWVIEESEFANVPAQIIELLHSWLAGEKIPTFHQVEDVSKKTHIPFGYFFLSSPPEKECDIVEFRTIDSVYVNKPSRELIDTVNTMSDIQEWLENNNKREGNDFFNYVGKYHGSNESVSEIVSDIRGTLDLEVDWYTEVKSSAESFRFLRNHISNIGVSVMANGIVGNNTHRKLNVKEFRAFTLINEYAPLIFINTCDTDNGKVFSLLHELAHIWIGKSSFYNEPYGTFNKVSSLETLCNAVAAEILVPSEEFIKEWNKKVSNDPEGIINELAKIFHCSRYVIARRARDYMKINKSEYNEIINSLDAQLIRVIDDQKKSLGGDFYRGLQSKWDHNFIRAINASASSGYTNYTDVYRLTMTNGKTFEKLVSEIGGVDGR